MKAVVSNAGSLSQADWAELALYAVDQAGEDVGHICDIMCCCQVCLRPDCVCPKCGDECWECECGPLEEP